MQKITSFDRKSLHNFIQESIEERRHKRSCREVPGLVNNEAWDVVEIRVGRGDLLDAEAAGDGEVERVEG